MKTERRFSRPPLQGNLPALLCIAAVLGLPAWGWPQSAPKGASQPAGKVPQGNCVEATAGLNLRMVWIPSGAFSMGSTDGYDDEEPVHTVELDGFWLAATEVTNRQYMAFVAKSGYDGGDSYEYLAQMRGEVPVPHGDDYPVVCVRWKDAKAFCDWLSKETGLRYSLPTEAQWEFACRAGSKGAWSFGDDVHQAPKYVCSFVVNKRSPRPVGSLAPNPWGLYDMHGNVWEWCLDRYGEDYYQHSPRRNPSGPAEGAWRVMRGGSWYENPEDARSAHRLGADPEKPVWHAGFRVCRLP